MTNVNTGEPLDSLTPNARYQVAQLGSLCTRACEIVQQKDTPVYSRIQRGIDIVNDQVHDIEVKCYTSLHNVISNDSELYRIV